MMDVIDNDIKNKIYEIRGKQVMLDSDLARLYHCKNGTKEINQAVKNNINKFPERYSWILTDEEISDLRSKFLTTNISNMSRVNPRAFTEQGVAMLATIIKSDVAAQTSIQIMGAFAAIKPYDGNNIKNKIYEIRGKQVMLDSDLAMLYECKNGTKTINQATNRHLDRFPSDFCFQLTNDEYLFLRSQLGTLKERGSHVKYMPYVFTEQGVAMLATILRTDIAASMSIRIMRAFVAMRHYIGDNEYRISNIETRMIDYDNRINLLEESFNKFEENKNEIYFEGQIWDARSKILEIFSEAKGKLIIIDSYADYNILDIIKRLDIEVILITTDKLLTKEDINKYNKQYHNLKVIYNNTFHDRYFILDDTLVYHCGTSINRIGYKTFSITLLNDIDVINLLINCINEIQI